MAKKVIAKKISKNKIRADCTKKSKEIRAVAKKEYGKAAPFITKGRKSGPKKPSYAYLALWRVAVMQLAKEDAFHPRVYDVNGHKLTLVKDGAKKPKEIMARMKAGTKNHEKTRSLYNDLVERNFDAIARMKNNGHFDASYKWKLDVSDE